MDEQVQRKYVFFVNGYEPSYFWWKGLKRTDLLITAGIMYTNIAMDNRSRIILFCTQGGLFLDLH